MSTRLECPRIRRPRYVMAHRTVRGYGDVLVVPGGTEQRKVQADLGRWELIALLLYGAAVVLMVWPGISQSWPILPLIFAFLAQMNATDSLFKDVRWLTGMDLDRPEPGANPGEVEGADG